MSPRGNDAAAAGTEFQARTGNQPNAEGMIAANAERWPAELRAANNRPIDQAATDEMDEDAVVSALDVEGEVEVLGWSVRGPFLVAVYEDEDGGIHKVAVTREGKEKQAQRLAPPQKDAEEADKEYQERAEKEHKEAEKEQEQQADEPEAAHEGAATPPTTGDTEAQNPAAQARPGRAPRTR